MIIDARQLPDGESLWADIAIVGSGPAGIATALGLAESGLAVLLIEAGGERAETGTDAYDGFVHDENRHPPTDLYRARGLGGTSSLWGGRCVTLDDIDFRARPWVPHSGWPIDGAELAAYYRRAMTICEAGEADFTAAALPSTSPPEMIPGFSDQGFATDRIERFSRPTHFGKRYKSRLARHPDITVLTYAACRNIALERDGVRIGHLDLVSASGHKMRVRARYFALAAGALETTRLLLVSDDVQRHGLGNQGDALGRYYMCHLEGKAGVLRLNRPDRPAVTAYELTSDRIYARRKIWLAEKTQQREHLLNFIARIEPPAIADPGHDSGILSAMYLSRTFLKAEYARKLASFGFRGAGEAGGRGALWSHYGRHLGNVIADSPALASFAATWLARHVLASRKLPYICPPSKNNAYHLDYNMEQMPNPESRVMLDPEKDRMGMRRLRIDWRVMAGDIDSLKRSYGLLAERVAVSGIGRLSYDPADLSASYCAIGGHHIGTARMAETPRDGVVDRNCKVFGTENLFVAGSAVFPTSGYANPTLTIVALALRLADHLLGLVGAPTPAMVPAMVETAPDEALAEKGTG